MSGAGNLSDLVTFEARSLTQNAAGQMVATWGTGFSAWCEVTRHSEINARFATHYRPGVTPVSHRMIWDGAIWNIHSVVHDRKRSMLTIESDFSEMLEVTHLQSTNREFIDGLQVLRPLDL